MLNSETSVRSEWKHTNPVLGNRWRALAKGHRVLAFPIWLYCDDTSGNLSKKWNEHNSVLFTPAGLPRTESQKEYNIHFLSTSNIAPPLEMMEGFVDQLEYVLQTRHRYQELTVAAERARRRASGPGTVLKIRRSSSS